MRFWVLVLALACLLGAVFAGLSSKGKPAAPVVLAAASLQEAMDEAAARWAAKGHDQPVISTAGSSALARQIEAGAPADLFVSADEQWMDYLEQRQLIRPGTRSSFLTNTIVLVAPAGSRVKLALGPDVPLAKVLGQGRLAMADPDAVPAGRYARQALENLNAWNSIAGRIASAQNVRAALALVSRGEAPLGIVYATDARADKGVRVVGTFPASSHAPVSYPLALLARSRSRDAEAFRHFLLSTEGQAIFVRHGFGTH